ncbi:MAG: CoA transferase [Nevskiaceae bacterium]|nr:MAG: CoA transferase [Nevskiaceae bacterium]TBR74870.1 MAG: CoA transferase [Nevskiaceae bacterium]
MLAGPFCSQVLADQGADVVKIESAQGDMSRTVGAYRADDAAHAFGGYYVSINRNKRSIVVDLKSASGVEVIHRLVAGADVVVENFRCGVMERLGLSYESLSALNPRLVYAAIRGFGDPRTGTSPYQEWPAFDVTAQAMGGIMGITGPDAKTPTKIGPGVGDLVPGLYAAFGILAAVHEAMKTGRGQYVDVSMVDCILALCERLVHRYSVSGAVSVPEGNGHPMLAPFGLFPACDGVVSIACPNDAFWTRLCDLLELPGMAADPRFATARSRVANRHALDTGISAHTSRLTKAELQAKLGGQLPFGPVMDAAEIFADPHFRARRMIVPVDCPGLNRPIEVAGVPVRMTRTPGGIRRRAPRLGEDTCEVLGECGYSAAELERLRRDGVIRQWIQGEEAS